jgi:hypothetical protein
MDELPPAQVALFFTDLMIQSLVYTLGPLAGEVGH